MELQQCVACLVLNAIWLQGICRRPQARLVCLRLLAFRHQSTLRQGHSRHTTVARGKRGSCLCAKPSIGVLSYEARCFELRSACDLRSTANRHFTSLTGTGILYESATNLTATSACLPQQVLQKRCNGPSGIALRNHSRIRK